MYDLHNIPPLKKGIQSFRHRASDCITDIVSAKRGGVELKAVDENSAASRVSLKNTVEKFSADVEKNSSSGEKPSTCVEKSSTSIDK